jgi:hypothetical protein
MERLQRRFDLPVMIAALLTIPVIVIEESNYGQPWDATGEALLRELQGMRTQLERLEAAVRARKVA